MGLGRTALPQLVVDGRASGHLCAYHRGQLVDQCGHHVRKVLRTQLTQCLRDRFR